MYDLRNNYATFTRIWHLAFKQGSNSNHGKQSKSANQGSLQIPSPPTPALTNACKSSCKAPVMLFDFDQNWNGPTNFSKTPESLIS
jgi:hypothetical protein